MKRVPASPPCCNDKRGYIQSSPIEAPFVEHLHRASHINLMKRRQRLCFNRRTHCGSTDRKYFLGRYVATVIMSAFAAPSVHITQYDQNEVGSSQYLTEDAFKIVDGGDTNLYILTWQKIVNDLSTLPDSRSQALALGQTLAVLIELSSGIPGDSCAAAALIDAHASGSASAIRSALANYVKHLTRNLDLVVQLAVNPTSSRYTVGPRGGCAGGGRSYQFESAWDAVLASASPHNAGLLNEQYCTSKRLYSAVNSRSNNVGAAVTAASLPPSTQVFEHALAPLNNFLVDISSGRNPSNAAKHVRNALLDGASRVQI